MKSFSTNFDRLSKAARHIAVITLGNLSRSTGRVRSRINIENTKQLKQSGFGVGTSFSVEYHEGMVDLKVDAGGGNTIAPKKFGRRDGSEVVGERLDLRSTQIFEKFGGEARAVALYLSGRIVIMRLPTVGSADARTAQLATAVRRGTLRTAALYSGVGTLDAALHQGFSDVGIRSEIAFANDSWPVAVDAMLTSHPAVNETTRTFTGGIEQFIASGMRLTNIDMAVIGIPCKGASLLNVKSRSAPEFHPFAGHQVINAMLALQQLNFPPLVLVENVAAYVNTASFSMLSRVLEEQGYQTLLVGDRDEDGRYVGINSNHYGDIERRVRMGLLAYPQGVEISMESMKKCGASVLTVGDIRQSDDQVDEQEYEKGKHLNRPEKVAKGWLNRIVGDDARSTPSLSADCWKQRVEDPKLRHQTDPTKFRIPTPAEHAALKGQDPSLINSLVLNGQAHTALGNGAAKKCWAEFAKVLGKQLKAFVASAIKRTSTVDQAWLKPANNSAQADLFAAL